MFSVKKRENGGDKKLKSEKKRKYRKKQTKVKEKQSR